MEIVDRIPRSADVVSDTDAEIIFISFDKLEKSFKDKTVISYKLMANIFQNMVFRLMNANEKYKIITEVISKVSNFSLSLEKENQKLKEQK
jgi:CRP-like cAMP-binding protein